MSSPENSGEPLPYYPNQYTEKLQMFSDAANMLLDVHGIPAQNSFGQPMEKCEWSDDEINTSYKLGRYRDEADIDPRIKPELQLWIMEQYPNGEVSEKCHLINPVTKVNSTTHTHLTAAMRAEHDKLSRIAEGLPEHQTPRPPRLDMDISPEHEMETRIQVLRRAFEIFES